MYNFAVLAAPTLRLLQEIADSLAPFRASANVESVSGSNLMANRGIFSQDSAPDVAERGAGDAVHPSRFSVEGKRKLGQRKDSGSCEGDDKIDMGAAAKSRMSIVVDGSAGSSQATGNSGANGSGTRKEKGSATQTRKRIRSSPGKVDTISPAAASAKACVGTTAATSSSKCGAWGDWGRATPPQRPKPPPSPRQPVEMDRPCKSGEKAGVSRWRNDRSSCEGIGDASESDGDEDFAKTAASGRRRRRSSKPLFRGGGGCVPSPATVVDLSSTDAEEPLSESQRTVAEEGLDDIVFLGIQADNAFAQKLTQVEYARGPTERGDGGMSSDNDTRQGRTKEEEMANKLLFLVSCNTGRVHVYVEPDGEGIVDFSTTSDDGIGGYDEDEERQPRHCRLAAMRWWRSWSYGNHVAHAAAVGVDVRVAASP